MAKVPITVMGFRCERCGHEWVPRESDSEPRVCPRCKSPYWNKPRKSASATSYEDFRDKIVATLKASSQPLTWTDIRTRGGLPQMFPNNGWVRRMEKDVGLRRQRDQHGVIHWQLTNEASPTPAQTAHSIGARPSRK
jgi:predicted Zn-ribbon and HTH transcriptional regulator